MPGQDKETEERQIKTLMIWCVERMLRKEHSSIGRMLRGLELDILATDAILFPLRMTADRQLPAHVRTPFPGRAAYLARVTEHLRRVVPDDAEALLAGI
ncbi:MAG: hypothetical protein RLZZ324_806 [Candidatus Parcubacteria bacterium]|jgi:hypothetical protein